MAAWAPLASSARQGWAGRLWLAQRGTASLAAAEGALATFLTPCGSTLLAIDSQQADDLVLSCSLTDSLLDSLGDPVSITVAGGGDGDGPQQRQQQASSSARPLPAGSPVCSVAWTGFKLTAGDELYHVGGSTLAASAAGGGGGGHARQRTTPTPCTALARMHASTGVCRRLVPSFCASAAAGPAAAAAAPTAAAPAAAAAPLLLQCGRKPEACTAYACRSLWLAW